MKHFILHTKNNFFFVLTFLVLCTILPGMAQAQATAKWPLIIQGDKQDSVQKIFCGYGNYDAASDGSEIHFHEGLDLLAPEDTTVYASEGGTIIDLNKLPHPIHSHYFNFIMVSRGTDTTEALIYMHMLPKGKWKKGDKVNVGEALGNIARHPSGAAAPHLHFGWHNKENGSWALTETEATDATGNPIEIFFNRADSIKPIIDSIRYRSQAGAYFTQKTASNDTVVKNDVDIVAHMWEQFNVFPFPNYNLNVTRIQFSAQEYKPGNVAQLPTQQPFNFLGKFLAACTPELNHNSVSKHLSDALTHIVYSNDNVSKSVPRYTGGGKNKGHCWYIITNKDTLTGDSLRNNSGAYSWYTKSRALPGVKWNNLYRDEAHVADSNKNAEYPDGRYIVTLFAWGYGHPLIDWVKRTDTMFINNHNEYIYSCDATGTLKDDYCKGEPVYITGKGYPKNRQLVVWLFKDADWNDNTLLDIRDPKFMLKITVTTDANGRIQPTMLWNSYAPNGDPDKGYDIIVDYDDDVYYTAPKEGFTVDVPDATPGPYSIIGKKLMVAPTKTDVSCFGKCNGTLSLTVTGGIAPYTYYWNDHDTSITQSYRDSLCAGTYWVNIVDSTGCIITDTIVINQPPALFVSCSGIATTCDSCNGMATMMASGGIPPYTYNWPGW